MSEKILFVDDDPHLLASCERNLRRQFPLDTAEGGEAGLAKLAEHGPYAVVVADRQMPRMDGIEFLATVKQRAGHHPHDVDRQCGFGSGHPGRQ